MNDLEDDGPEVDGLVKEDADGNRIITTYYREADGRQMKCERKVAVKRKTQRFSINVKERQKKWQKFGLERLNFDEGDLKKFSTVSSAKDEPLKPGRRMGLLAQDSNENQFAGVLSTSVFDVGKRQLFEVQRLFEMLVNPDAKALLAMTYEKEESNIPSIMQDRNMKPVIDTDDRTVRVTNLPEYTDEDDLKTLFNRCGAVQRLFLARNKETNVSKGFAFITYKVKEDATRAIAKLHKVGFQNVLLNVEWAKRKTPIGETPA